MSLRSSMLLLVAVGLSLGCPRKTKQYPASPPPDETDTEEPTPPDLPEPEGGVPPPEPDVCAEGGRLWDGKPEDCSYEHAGCCYDSAAAACAAAGCAAEDCNVLESYPAQIHCRG